LLLTDSGGNQMSKTTELEKKDTNSKKKGGLKKVIENLQSEFKKIIWPTKDSLVKRTTAVIASTVALGVIIGLVDMIIKYGLGFIIS
jgi:preprotein translocase subunit SecE